MLGVSQVVEECSAVREESGAVAEIVGVLRPPAPYAFSRPYSANFLRGFLCNVDLSISPRKQNAIFRISISLYFAKPVDGRVFVSGQIKIDEIEGVIVRLKSEEWPITVSSGGEIFTTIQPLEKLSIIIEAPGYRPPKWDHHIKPTEA